MSRMKVSKSKKSLVKNEHVGRFLATKNQKNSKDDPRTW